MADLPVVPSSPLSSPPQETPELSPARHGEMTPSAIGDITLNDTGPSSHDVQVEDSPYEPSPKKRKTTKAKSAAAGDKNQLYPAGLVRLTRFGKGTYGINTGPLPDDTDWDSLGIPAIREQLKMRGVDHLGVKADILARIKDWKPHVGKENQEALNLTHKPAFEYTPDDFAKSAAAKRGPKWQTGTNDGAVRAASNALADTMYLLNREDLDWDDGQNDGMIESATFTIRTDSMNTYTVVIGKRCTCDCPAKKFRPQSHCKHILYILIWVLRGPEQLIQQQALIPHEVNLLLTNGPKLRPSQVDIQADPTMTDGKPNSKAGCDCPVCFRPLKDSVATCCQKCGRHTHNDCFNVWANHSTFSLACPTCRAKWTQPIPPKILLL
ncbi:hypothetical protein F5X68DRAFT_229690 [Plectosphaerella plurivora]|uniref:Postreplication repair E3 ubiquitin-protein ligase RAD18 n=1 Tax=Plectosphaerella plurivora TaxID=936078 RepID=A0A9P8VGS1_9PEZI|nr:hypothetical protein F5X68DRAFT_229690 [Plectosphaerella plurivora]